MNQTPNSSLNLSFEHSRDGSGIRCAFCNGEHYSSACEEVKEIQKRKNILRRDKPCFLCLSVGHRATSVPGRNSVDFVTGQIIISQFVK